MAAQHPEPGPAAKPPGAEAGPARFAELRTSSSFEYRSRLRIGGLPLVHVVRGIDPSTGARPPAIGVIAVGQVAVGAIAVGQLAIGVVALGQAAIGLGWGVGQLACGLLAVGQVAAGMLGSVGQVALGPHALGLVQDHAPWAALAWLLGGLALGAAVLARLQRLGALVGRRTGAPAALASLRDGRARAAAHVLSENRLRAPLSNRPCVFWHSVRVGPGVRALERGGGEIAIADDSGTARVDLDSAVTFICNDRYAELPAPDWSLQLETFLARGDGALHRGAGAPGARPARARRLPPRRRFRDLPGPAGRAAAVDHAAPRPARRRAARGHGPGGRAGPRRDPRARDRVSGWSDLRNVAAHPRLRGASG